MENQKLEREFYLQDTVEIAKNLLGKTLVHKISGKTIKAKIIETEAYLGLEDKAAHSYGGKKTPRTEIMYAMGGFAYVYFIYGMYYCFNVVTREEGNPQAVLIRAVEPLECSKDMMSQNRYGLAWSELSNYQRKNLCNGPGKLAIAYGFDKSGNGVDLIGDEIYIETPTAKRNRALEVEQDKNAKIIATKRIDIDYAQEAKDWELRFYLES